MEDVLSVYTRPYDPRYRHAGANTKSKIPEWLFGSPNITVNFSEHIHLEIGFYNPAYLAQSSFGA
jgi:hypothetical protein